MKLLRRYQLDIIFLFFALLVLTGITFYTLKQFGADPHDYEWIAIGPLIIFYIAHLISIRNKISIKDRRRITGASLTYWLLLGITIIIGYQSPISASDYWSINLFFLVFTLLLADSYWDFRKISIRKLAINKKHLEKV